MSPFIIKKSWTHDLTFLFFEILMVNTVYNVQQRFRQLPPEFKRLP